MPRKKPAATDTSDRARWRYGELSEADVVEAALQFARREGLDQLTMRKLAAELGVSSTNAYYYVPSKEALFDLAAEAVLGQVPDPPDELHRWDEQLRFLFESARTVLLQYPGVSDHLLVREAGPPQQRRLYLLTKKILTDAGFDRATINHTQRTLTYLLLGAVSQELATDRSSADRPDAVRFTDDDEVFDFGLDLMLEGLTVRLKRSRAHRLAAR